MPDHAPLSEPLFHILLSLVDGPRHGYGIIQEVESRTSGAIRLGAGTLYSAIKRIRAAGWVEEVRPPTDDDPRRRYYGLTSVGRRVVRSEARRLEALVKHARAKRVLTRGA
ncbi:MAG: PadR family transcriptional regulator [Gemmatimonadales bacterium]